MRPEIWLPLAWVAISLALRIGWVGLRQNLKWPGQAEARWERPARFFYFIGLPYLALISGTFPPDLLGLKGVGYFSLIPWSSQSLAGSFQQALSLLLLEWLLDSQLLLPLSLVSLLGVAGLRWHLRRNEALVPAPRISILEIIYSGFHWAFYRAAFWSATGDLYLGIVWGLGLVVIEWLLLGWLQNRFPAQAPLLLVQGIVLILTSLLFFYIPNLWLIWPVQGVMLLLLTQPPRTSLSTST